MKGLVYFVLTVLILGVGFHFYLRRQEPVPTLPSAPSAKQTGTSLQSVPIDWQVVERAGDGFKIDMPGNIQAINVPASNENGGTDPVQMIMSNPDRETSYSLAWEDDPPVARASDRTADRILDLARDGALFRTQSTLLNESRSNPSGLAGRDFVSRNVGGGVMNARMILVGQRLYTLMVAFPSASARQDQDVARFFNSFTITSFSNIPPAQASASTK